MKAMKKRLGKVETWVMQGGHSFGLGDPGYGLASLLRLRHRSPARPRAGAPGGLVGLLHTQTSEDARNADKEIAT